MPLDLAEYRVRVPAAFDFLFKPARYKGAYGGRGSGKSHAFADALVSIAATEERRIFCGREIQKSIADSSKQLLDDKINSSGLPGFRSTDTYIENSITGSRFMFGGLRSNPESIKSAEGIDIAWLEEANKISQRSLDLLRPTLRGSPRLEVSEIWASWNPKSKFDAVDKLLRGDKLPPGAVVRKVSWRDNPFFPQVLRDEMEYDRLNDPDKYEHVWEGAYEGAPAGAYYRDQLRQARAEGRLDKPLFRDPMLPVRTIWDLGIDDSTAVWVAQTVGQEIRYLAYIEGSGQPLSYYVNELRALGYGPECEVILPHDGGHRILGLNDTKAIEDHMKDAGYRRVRVIPNQGKGAAMARIEAARRLFPRMKFDSEKTPDGLRTLEAYHEKRDEDRNVGLGPDHDWASHGADAFGLDAVSFKESATTAWSAPIKYDNRGIV